MNTAGKVVIGVAAGLAVGAALGILFAPAKGTETRNNLLKKGEGYSDAVKGKLNGILDTIATKFESVKESISHKLEAHQDANTDHNDNGKGRIQERAMDYRSSKA